MGKEEKGFFDELIDDFAATAEMKAAIEASRDENGKIDVAKATGLSMGLGHTSDNDIALMGALLGAEGAFDESDDTDDFLLDDTFDLPAPTYAAPAGRMVTEEQYAAKKAAILSGKRNNAVGCFAAICVITLFFLYLMSAATGGTGVYMFLMLAIDGLLAFTIHYDGKQKERALSALEKEYSESKRKREQAEKAQKEYDEIKNYAGTTDLVNVRNQIPGKIKYLFDQADRVCGIAEPSFDYHLVDVLLSGLFYCAVKACDAIPARKSPLFDLTLLSTGTSSECTGDMLFPIPDKDLDTALRNMVNETFTCICVAAYQSGNPDKFTDITKTICSLMVLLGEELDTLGSKTGFSKSGVSVTLKAVEHAARRVIDDKLLG